MLYIKEGHIKSLENIIIRKTKYIVVNPTEEMVLADGWEIYTPTPIDPSKLETTDSQLQDLLLEEYNSRTDITDAEALKRPLLVYAWDTYINKSLKTGQIVSYNEKLYRVRQNIAVVLEDQFPALTTAALYEVIEVEPTGTQEDPIPYTPPMEIFNGKYYTQNDVLYKCTRDSQTALTHDLSALVGLYVEKVA